MKALLSIKETADYLGISVRHIYKLVAAEQFGPDPVRIGRSVKFRVADLQRWVDLGCPSRHVFRKHIGAAEKTA